MKHNGLLKLGLVWVLIFVLFALSITNTVSLQIPVEKVGEVAFPHDATKGFDDSYYLQEPEDINLVISAVNNLELKNGKKVLEEELILTREDCETAVFFIYLVEPQVEENFLVSTQLPYGMLISKSGYVFTSHITETERYYKQYEVSDYSDLLAVLDTMREKHKEQAEMFPYW